jgi:hypothetical protein
LQTNLYAFSPPSKKLIANQVQVNRGGQGAFPLPAPWPAYPQRRNGIHILYFAFQAVDVKEKNKNFVFRLRRAGEIPDKRTTLPIISAFPDNSRHLFVIGRFFFFRLFFMLSGDYFL